MKFIIKPPSKILQKQVNGLLFGYKTGLQIRKINAYNSKNIFFLNSRVYRPLQKKKKKINSSAHPLSRNHNDGFLNNNI